MQVLKCSRVLHGDGIHLNHLALALLRALCLERDSQLTRQPTEQELEQFPVKFQ